MNRRERCAIFAQWINERDRIRRARESGMPKPWTTDHILAQFRFCNVRREDDKVTRWIARHWREPNADHPNLCLGMALARLFNLPETLAELGFPEQFEPVKITQVVNRRLANGQRVWNAAYMITTCRRRKTKLEHVLTVLGDLHARDIRPRVGDTLEGFADRLMKIDGLGGGFLAGQIVADLKYAPPLAQASDWWSWAIGGPGSLRGLSWWAGETITQLRFRETLQALVVEVSPLVDDEVGNLHAQDWQSVCCEVDKYVRALEGRGRPKQLYEGSVWIS